MPQKLTNILKPITLASLRFFSFAFILLLFACDSYEVAQIEVDVPAGLKVPEDMVYIPAGDFIMGHKEEPRTRLGMSVASGAYFIDRYEVTREQFKKFKPKYIFSVQVSVVPCHACFLLGVIRILQGAGQAVANRNRMGKSCTGYRW